MKKGHSDDTNTSAIDGQSFLLQELEQVMKPLGYMVNGGWEYDHGYFDYKIDDRDGYLFLRVPVNAVQGSLDERGAAVRIGTPFMLRQVLQTDVDDQAEGGPFQSLFNQLNIHISALIQKMEEELKKQKRLNGMRS